MEMKEWIGKGPSGKLLLCYRNVKQLVSRIPYGQYPNLFDIWASSSSSTKEFHVGTNIGPNSLEDAIGTI